MPRYLIPAVMALFLGGWQAGMAAEPDGAQTVCLLFNETGFKEKLALAMTDSLTARGYSVVSGRTGDAASFRPADFLAVVYMAEYRAFHAPGNQQDYSRSNPEARNIVFVTTSLSQSARKDNPLDAVTGASKEADIPAMSGAVLERLDKILRK